MFNAILFDCDGVIVDTEKLSNHILQQELQKLGLSLTHTELHQQFSGFTTERNLITASQLLGRPLPDDFAKIIKTRFQEAINKSLETIDGVPALLSKITLPIAMATNARREEMEFKLAKVNLLERFSVRFCVDDVTHPKPAADLYLAAAAALGVDPSTCLVIEDSLAGIRAGVAAGMTVYAYSENMDPAQQRQAGAQICFSSMAELEKQLGL